MGQIPRRRMPLPRDLRTEAIGRSPTRRDSALPGASRGGGWPELAQSGGPNAEGMAEALQAGLLALRKRDEEAAGRGGQRGSPPHPTGW